MAGRTKTRQKAASASDDPQTNAELYELLQTANAELDRLRPLVLDIDPLALLSSSPEPITTPTEQTYKLMIACGIAGLTPAEIRTKCGINSEKHSEWMKTISQYRTAFLRARDASYMQQMQRIRLAVSSKDWKFPYNNAVKMLGVMLETDENGRDIGNAEDLIVLNPHL